MTTQKAIDGFLSQKKLALVRASRKAAVQGFSIDTELAKRSFSVSVVYLDEPAAQLKDLAEKVGGVIIASPASQSEQAVQQSITAGIAHVWLQKGCDSKKAIQLCHDNNIALIHNECVMMFVDPVKSFHAFHRWIMKVLGKLPK